MTKNGFAQGQNTRIYNPGKPGGKQIEKQCEYAHWVSTWHSNMITRTFHTIQTEDCKNTNQMKNNKPINDDEQSIKVLMHPFGRPLTTPNEIINYIEKNFNGIKLTSITMLIFIV